MRPLHHRRRSRDRDFGHHGLMLTDDLRAPLTAVHPIIVIKCAQMLTGASGAVPAGVLRMRLAVAVFGVGSALAGIGIVHADHQPAFVVPARPNVPVPINGYNAAWGVVEGDWGLYRPGAAPGITVIPSPYTPPLVPERPVSYRPARPYYPTLGTRPFVGRLEIEPPPDRPLPKPVEGYSRSWSVESPDVPPTQYAPTPPMMISPEVNFNSPWGGGEGPPGPNPPRPRPPHRR